MYHTKLSYIGSKREREVERGRGDRQAIERGEDREDGGERETLREILIGW